MRNKKREKKKKDSLSYKILNLLGEKSNELLDLSKKIIFDPRTLAMECGWHSDSRLPHYVSREISNLRRNSCFEEKNGKFYVTQKGREKIIKNILASKSKKNYKWSGFWLGIIFDVPEANRRERNFLRRELNFIGCKEIQKSVWITPFDIKKELTILTKLWRTDFAGDIKFLKITEISDEKEIKRRFYI